MGRGWMDERCHDSQGKKRNAACIYPQRLSTHTKITNSHNQLSRLCHLRKPCHEVEIYALLLMHPVFSLFYLDRDNNTYHTQEMAVLNMYNSRHLRFLFIIAWPWCSPVPPSPSTAFARSFQTRVYQQLSFREESLEFTGFLGTASTKWTPPSSRLALETRFASQLLMLSATSGVALSGDWGTMYARGSSSPSL
jgi:hypothetical protein